jgi:hypothetical protein
LSALSPARSRDEYRTGGCSRDRVAKGRQDHTRDASPHVLYHRRAVTDSATPDSLEVSAVGGCDGKSPTLAAGLVASLAADRPRGRTSSYGCCRHLSSTTTGTYCTGGCSRGCVATVQTATIQGTPTVRIPRSQVPTATTLGQQTPVVPGLTAGPRGDTVAVAFRLLSASVARHSPEPTSAGVLLPRTVDKLLREVPWFHEVTAYAYPAGSGLRSLHCKFWPRIPKKNLARS